MSQITQGSGAQICYAPRNAAHMGTVKMGNASAKNPTPVSAVQSSAAQVTVWEKDVVPMGPAYAKMVMPERTADACGV